MGVISIPFSDPDLLATGVMHVENGPWVGSKKILHFTDTVFGNEGTILCDCRESTPRIRLDQTFSPMGGVGEISKVLSMMLRPFLSNQFNSSLYDTIQELYTQDYCLECLDPLLENSLDDNDRTVAQQVIDQLETNRILVAGCGAGRGLLKLRELGADAWGVDISPDLDKIVLPEARPFIRQGSVHDLPFENKEKFETLICLGVLEHLPEDLVELVPLEAERLGIRHLVTMLDHDDFIRPGHLTLRPLSWWAARMVHLFNPIPSAFPLPAEQPAMPWGPNLASRLRLWVRTGEATDDFYLKYKAEKIPVAASSSLWDDPMDPCS